MQLKDIAPSYGISVTIAVPVFFLKYLPISDWVILPMQIVLGFFVLYLLCKVIKPKEYEELLIIIKPYLDRIQKKQGL